MVPKIGLTISSGIKILLYLTNTDNILALFVNLNPSKCLFQIEIESLNVEVSKKGKIIRYFVKFQLKYEKMKVFTSAVERYSIQKKGNFSPILLNF